jgi:serine/threonine-protein kinase HipA
MKMTSLFVSTPEGRSGRVFTSAADFIFRYDEDALPDMAISLAMPVRPDEFRRRDLHPIFQMNLPEGYVPEQLRNRLAKKYSTQPGWLRRYGGTRFAQKQCPPLAAARFRR